MSSIWLKNTKNLYLNSFCFGYRLNTLENFDTYFLSQVFRTKSFRAKIQLLAQGISRFNIAKTKVMELSINFPLKEEQKKIGLSCKLLDDLISLHQRKLEKLKNIKKAMLEKMFI